MLTDESSKLNFDRKVFLESFPGRHFRFEHRLRGHPLFDLERLRRLARELPPRCIECASGNLAVSQDPRYTPTTGLSVDRTIASIDTCQGWVALKYVELDADYRELLADCVMEISPFSERCQGGTHQLEGYIFISSPESVTPFHFDDEHNFLLQLRGSKTVHTWSVDGPGAVSHLELENTYVGGHRNIPLRPEISGSAHVYALQPGQGLHIPVHSPHWVKNGDEVSVSFSVTFRTRKLTREATVHWLNGKLRRRGLSPRPYGSLPLLDSSKYWTARLARFVVNRLRRG